MHGNVTRRSGNSSQTNIDADEPYCMEKPDAIQEFTSAWTISFLSDLDSQAATILILTPTNTIAQYQDR